MNTTAQRKRLQFFLKIGLLVLAVFFISKRLYSSGFESVFNYRWRKISTYLPLFFILWFFNLFWDVLIWKSVHKLLKDVSFRKAFQSNLAAYALSFITPMNTGEIAARYLMLPKNTDRRKAIFLVFWSHFPRLIAKVIFGLSAVFFLAFWSEKIPFILAALLSFLVIVVSLSILFSFQKIQRWLSEQGFGNFSLSKYMWTDRPLFDKKLQLLCLASIKFLTYNFQFIVLLLMWGSGTFSPELIASVLFFFFISALLPTFAFADFLMKGAVAIFIFQNVLPQESLLLNVTLVMWLFNVAFPAVVGGFFVANKNWERAMKSVQNKFSKRRLV